MTETGDLSLLSALLQSVNVLPFSKHAHRTGSHLFHSGLPLNPSTVRGSRLGVGVVVGVKGRWVEEGREERKAKSVDGGEEALSYPGGSVSQCSYILGG